MDLESHPSPNPDPEKTSIVSKMKAAPQLRLLTSPTSPNLKRKRQEAQLRSRAELQREQDEERRVQALRRAQQKASELTARNGRSLQLNKYPSRSELPSSVRTFQVATGNQKGREREKERERQGEIGDHKSSSLNRQVNLDSSTPISVSAAKPFPPSNAQQDSIPIKPIPPTNFYKSKSTPDSPSPPPPTRKRRPPLAPKRDITRRKARRISPLPDHDDDDGAWNETPVEENFRREESLVNKLHESPSQVHPSMDPAPVPQNGISKTSELNPNHQTRTLDGDERDKRLSHHLHKKTAIQHTIHPAPRHRPQPQSKLSDEIINPKSSTSNLQSPSTALESSTTPPKKKKYKSATQPRQRGPRAMTRSESAKFSGSRASSPLEEEKTQCEMQDEREQKGKKGLRKSGDEEDEKHNDGNDGKREGNSREAGKRKVVVHQEKEKGKGKGSNDSERKEAKSVGAEGQVDEGAAKLRSSKVNSNLGIDGKRKASEVQKRETSISSRKEQIDTSTRSGKSSIRKPKANLVNPINPTNTSNSKPTDSKDPTSTEAERAFESKNEEIESITMTKHGESHQARASERKDEGMQEESIVLDSMPGAFGEDDEGGNLLVDLNLNYDQHHPPGHKLLLQQRDEDRDHRKVLDLDLSRNAKQDTAQTQNQPRKSTTAAAGKDRAEEEEGGIPEAQVTPDPDDAQADSEFDSGSENEEDFSQFIAEDSIDPLDLLPEFKKCLRSRSRSSSRIGIERELEGARERGRGKGLGNERDEKTCRRKENQIGETSRKRNFSCEDPNIKSKNQGEPDRARENQEKVLNPNLAKNPDSKTISNEDAIERISESEVSNDENQEEEEEEKEEKDEDRIQKSQSLSLSSSISNSAASRGKSPIESSSDTPRPDPEFLPISRSRNDLFGQSEARNGTKVFATEEEGTNFPYSNQPRWEEIPFLKFNAHQLRLVPESLSSSPSSEVLEMDRNHLARSKAYEDAYWIRKEIPDPIPSLEISAKSWRFGVEPPSRTGLMKEVKDSAEGRDPIGRENGEKERGNGRRKFNGWKQWTEDEEHDQTLPENASQENDLGWKDEIKVLKI